MCNENSGCDMLSTFFSALMCDSPVCLPAVITSLAEANGSLVCWFCLVLFQWFFLSGRMSARCARLSLRTLDVILSTWSLHYLLSSTMLPSRCSATWNAWLASSLKPSWNCVLKRRRLFLLSPPPSSHVCRSQKRFLHSDDCCSVKRKTHKTSFERLPLFTPHSFYWCLKCGRFYCLQQYQGKLNGHMPIVV